MNEFVFVFGYQLMTLSLQVKSYISNDEINILDNINQADSSESIWLLLQICLEIESLFVIVNGWVFCETSIKLTHPGETESVVLYFLPETAESGGTPSKSFFIKQRNRRTWLQKIIGEARPLNYIQNHRGGKKKG